MEHKCKHCGNEFNSADALSMHMNAKHDNEPKGFLSKSLMKKIKIYSIVGVVLILLIFSGLALTNRKSLPPKDMAGHIEVVPDTKILKKPMDLRIHKHILEHFDGKDGSRGGIIINYDCKTYSCSSDMVLNLEDFTKTYEYVYVAPYKNMKSKIVLTKLNRQITFDDFNKEQIEQFLKY